MSKLLFGALILMMVALLACNGEDPTQAPAATMTPTSAPTPQLEPTPVPTATLSPTATPTPAPSPTATSVPTMAPPQQQVSYGEGIAPLPLDDPQALMSELSEVERTCISGSGNSRRLSATLQAPAMASQEDIAELSLCLWNTTLLRLLMTGIVGQDGMVSGESAACIRTRLDGIDVRSSEVLALIAEEKEGRNSSVFRMAITCLNEGEWAVAAPVLGLSLNYREGVECLTRELGGQEEATAALELYKEQGLSFDLAADAAGCGMTEADLLALSGALPPPAIALDPGGIALLDLADAAAFMSELSPTEQSCVSTNVDPEQLPLILGDDPETAPAQADALIQCLEDEILLRLFISRLIQLADPLSAETSACILGGMEGVDLRPVMSPGDAGDEQAALVSYTSAYVTSLSCLSDAEWETASAGLAPEDAGQRASAQCVMERLGGPEGLNATLQSEDGSGAITIITAALGCGLQIDTGTGG